MGYKKIVQYADIIEIFEYEREIKRKRQPSWLQAERLANGSRSNYGGRLSKHSKLREAEFRKEQKKRGLYQRSASSIRRSKINFFRLCHHNNYYADTICFLTLTFNVDVSFLKANRYVSEFFRRIKSNKGNLSLDYISVPELTKKGRLHFHLLVYNLPPETAELERKTRNLQRQFQRGFLDIRFASYNSEGIAGYMAKYMAKALADSKNESTRGYTCSRGIKRFTTAGSNYLDEYNYLVIPDDIVISQTSSYDVPYLGNCKFTKIIKIK